MNLLTGKIVGASRERAEVALPDGTRVAARVDAHLANAGDRATLGIRPEHVVVHDPRDAMPNEVGAVTLEASHVEHVGGASFVYLQGAALGCSGQDALLTVREDGETLVRSGDRLTVILPEAECHLFGADGKAFKRT
jgi:ABC-type sugar transport system ATPase subunit